MTTPPPIVYVWHQITARDIGKKAMLPFSKHSRLADNTYTSGHAYQLMVREERRTPEQNDKMWPLLADCAAQLKLHGRPFDKDQWKAIMLHAWGQEVEFLPTLDENSFFPYGQQTSKLSKREMSSFIEFIIAEGTKRGVKFADDPADHDRQAG
jgi:hypothetical protein